MGSFVDNLVLNMSKKTRDDFRRAWDFLKGKTDPVRETLAKAFRSGDEREICFAINGADYYPMNILMDLYAFEESWELAHRIEYYSNVNIPIAPNGIPVVTSHTSKEMYERYREFKLEYSAPWKNTERHCIWCRYQLSLHETESFLKHAMDRCFGTRVPPTAEIWNYNINPRQARDAPEAFGGALALINLDQFDLAEFYIDALKGYVRMGSSGSQPIRYHPKYFKAAPDFLDHLLKARRADTPDDVRRWAAEAITANFRMVVDCFDSPRHDAASSFLSRSPTLALCTAIEFDLSPDWSLNCCRAILHAIDIAQFHGIISKAKAADCWMWTPDKFGLLPSEKVCEIRQLT